MLLTEGETIHQYLPTRQIGDEKSRSKLQTCLYLTTNKTTEHLRGVRTDDCLPGLQRDNSHGL